MSQGTNRYPSIGIRSKNEIAKRISSNIFSFKDALCLINDVLKNYDKYWKDVEKHSKPEEGKYVRSAKYKPLGKLLNLIDKKIMAPFDYLVPNFIFGGISGRNHVQAVSNLLGYKTKRTKLGLDISKFFEQNKRERVFYFFYKKAKCSKIASNILADLCCVPMGPKNSNNKEKVLARGFSTSTRLAVWCNLDLFFRVYWKTKEILKNKDSKISIFIDDIGITASKVSEEKMMLLNKEIVNILENFDNNQVLPINPNKTTIKSHLKKEQIEYLGLKICKKKLALGHKTRLKKREIKSQLNNKNISKSDKKSLLLKRKGILSYEKYIKTY